MFQDVNKKIYIPDIIPLTLNFAIHRYNGVHRVLSDGAKQKIPTIRCEIEAVVRSETNILSVAERKLPTDLLNKRSVEDFHLILYFYNSIKNYCNTQSKQ